MEQNFIILGEIFWIFFFGVTHSPFFLFENFPKEDHQKSPQIAYNMKTCLRFLLLSYFEYHQISLNIHMYIWSPLEQHHKKYFNSMRLSIGNLLYIILVRVAWFFIPFQKSPWKTKRMVYNTKHTRFCQSRHP